MKSFPVLLLVVLLLFLSVSVDLVVGKKSKKNKGGKKNKKESEDSQYYDIYATVDTLQSLTSHRTFYDLLGVSPDASDDEISRAFRKTAIQYHPDKLGTSADARTEKLSHLVQSIGTLMRSEGGRRRYDWVLNEAPAWHRMAVYYAARQNKNPTAKLTPWSVLWIAVLLSLLIQYSGAWASYLIERSKHEHARKNVEKMNEKEIRRMRERLDQGQLPAIGSPGYYLLVSEAEMPSSPSFKNLWPVKLLRLPICYMSCKSNSCSPAVRVAANIQKTKEI